METTLPVEVILHIVDELGSNVHEESARDALLSLALTSTTICRHAYQFLFAKLDVFFVLDLEDQDSPFVHQSQSTFGRLQQTLAQGLDFPGLSMVYWLRAVSITISRTFPIPWNTFQHTPAPYIPELAGVVNALHGPSHGITSFTLNINDRLQYKSRPHHSITDRQLFSAASYEALLALWRSERLATLHLEGIFLPSTILRDTNVVNLQLEHLTFKQNEPILQFVNNIPQSTPLEPLLFPPRLTDLTLSIMDPAMRIIIAPQLQALRLINYGGGKTGEMDMIFEMARSPFLETRVDRNLNLGSVTHLTIDNIINNDPTLLLRYFDPDSPLSPMSVITVTLLRRFIEEVDSHLASRSQLRHIRFSFKFNMEERQLQDISDSDPTSFVERNRKVVLNLFPRLAAMGSRFSLDIVLCLQDTVLDKATTTVTYTRNGPESSGR